MTGKSTGTHWLLTRCVAGLLVLFALAAGLPPATAQTPVPVWAKAMGGPGVEAMLAMATGADGSIYLGGAMTSPTFEAAAGVPVLQRIGDVDMLIVKTAADGRVIWARNFGGAGADARSMGLTVDATGNVFFTAAYAGNAVDIDGIGGPSPGGGMNMAVAKLRPDGTADWVRHFSSTGSMSIIYPGRVLLDPQGNPVVVADFAGDDIDVLGQTLSAGSALGALVVAKLNGTTGNRIWAHGSGGTGQVLPAGADIDPAGNIYVTGYYTLGSPDFGVAALDPQATPYIFLVKFDPAGAAVWARTYGGAGASTTTTASSLVVDPGGAAYLAGMFADADIAVGGTTLTWAGGAAGKSDILAFKVDTSGAVAWARSWGTSQGASMASSIARDAAGNIYVAGGTAAGIQLDPNGPPTTQVGTTDGLLFRLAADSGNVAWVTSYGGPNTTVLAGWLAAVSPTRIAIGGNYYAGPVAIGTTALPLVGLQNIFLSTVAQQYPLSLSVSGTGTVTSAPAGIACGATCVAGFDVGTTVTLTAVPGPGQSFIAWSGQCSGAAATTVTLDAGRNCAARFTATTTAPPSVPPAPPPSFVSTTNPPPPVVNIETSATGQGSFSLAGSFTGPGLTFAAGAAGGGALPDWLHFDPATASFSYTLPLPAGLPTGDVRAARTTSNPVFPPAILVQTVPVTLTVGGGGQTYAVTIDLDFHAPRLPTAMAAISLAPKGQGGDAASSRPALSWDGGQVVFETRATNINPAAGWFSSIARYHGLSGKRDLLSQTAVPGGGVANGANGNSTNPVVAASGSHAAFSSDAPGLSAISGNGLRQVYRTDLAWPRVPLNEAATPAAIMVSTTASGIAADAAADLAVIAEHGGFVAFESAAGNLGDNPGRHLQVWRKDMDGGRVALVSSTAAGVAGNGASRNVSLSWDGRFAVFDSTATNLVPGSTGRQIYLKDMANSLIYRLSTAAGSTPKIDARATSVVYVSGGQILRYDIASGATAPVTAGPDGADQPALSADGRFVVYRSAGQIHVADVMRGAIALVSQTAAGLPGNGASSDPAISGDGATIAFASQARDLVNGMPLAGQIHLAGNPLVLPGRTAYWYSPDGGNQTWSVERWGDRALVVGLAYAPDGGPAVWAAGECRFAGLACQGVLQQWSNGGGAARAVGLFTMTFGADGATASMALGATAPRALALYPVGGPRTAAFAGLPQNGYWGAAGNGPGVSSLFIDTDTQVGPDGASQHQAHVTLFGYDAAGQAQWYAAQGVIAPGRTFTGQLHLYAGGASWQGGGSAVPSAIALGTLRLNFSGPGRAMLQLPDGRAVAVGRWRF